MLHVGQTYSTSIQAKKYVEKTSNNILEINDSAHNNYYNLNFPLTKVGLYLENSIV